MLNRSGHCSSSHSPLSSTSSLEMSFPYKSVLVIGATAGIGLALAERMIENGIFVIGVGRRQSRLDEFISKHGSDKAAGSQFDITNLDGIKSWAENIVATYPSIDAVVLNSGIQRALDFTDPASIDLSLVQRELTTNYTSYISLITHLLPQLRSQAPKPTALLAITSGLALIPIPRVPNYCATKSALHSLCWSLRTQLYNHEGSKHIRVIEIAPPAVQTELHTQQGLDQFGMPLEKFTDEVWERLNKGDVEIVVGRNRAQWESVEGARRKIYDDVLPAFGFKPASL
ncbi:uncharacterized protein BCR38DRAFT_424876 [Pseudomassariella vexata]|uniref:Short chain dehydrogenase n=1 Tax=Pseudomassariella vexata TaxID=1141098 RepID=A0A1Y2EBL5_9PEZI|nr:uncharacterized protein BCR38DRAFT_424876 [Pseudomassariella vexata]ORY68963.1 hypothetical protein BCR38DRAFT_424876 [Pseudomassariella vexata]